MFMSAGSDMILDRIQLTVNMFQNTYAEWLLMLLIARSYELIHVVQLLDFSAVTGSCQEQTCILQ